MIIKLLHNTLLPCNQMYFPFSTLPNIVKAKFLVRKLANIAFYSINIVHSWAHMKHNSVPFLYNIIVSPQS